MNWKRSPSLWFFMSLTLTLWLGSSMAFAEPPDNRPPHNRPPSHDQPSNPTSTSEAGAQAGALAASLSGADSRSASGALAEGGAGGDGGSAFAKGGTGEGGHGGSGTGGEGGASGGNEFRGGDNESTYLNLSMAPINIDGCIVAKHVGGGDGNGGAIIQWGSVNHTCVMNEMANAERHVMTRAMLKCGAKEYRNALAYDMPSGVWPFNRKQTKSRQEYCINHTVAITMGEIDYLKELLLKPEPPAETAYEVVSDPK